MGFWDSLGKFASEAIKNGINEKKADWKNYQKNIEQYEKLEDEKLIKRFKSETDLKKKLAMKYVLEQRGYGNKES